MNPVAPVRATSGCAAAPVDGTVTSGLPQEATLQHSVAFSSHFPRWCPHAIYQQITRGTELWGARRDLQTRLCWMRTFPPGRKVGWAGALPAWRAQAFCSCLPFGTAFPCLNMTPAAIARVGSKVISCPAARRLTKFKRGDSGARSPRPLSARRSCPTTPRDPSPGSRGDRPSRRARARACRRSGWPALPL